MIILKDLFTLLATGEFSNISLQKDRSGNIEECEYEGVIGHINLGVVELFKRFKLLEQEIRLHAIPSVQTYHMRPIRVTSLENISSRDYLERPDDYDGNINIVEITAVYDTDGTLLKINNRHTTPVIKQVSSTSLKITGLETDTIFDIVYQAFPPQIVLDDDLDIEEYEIDIPETIIEPLLYYIASRVYKPMGSNDSTANSSKSEGYQQQYELSCQKISLFGLDIQDDDTDPEKFARNGWA